MNQDSSGRGTRQHCGIHSDANVLEDSENALKQFSQKSTSAQEDMYLET